MTRFRRHIQAGEQQCQDQKQTEDPCGNPFSCYALVVPHSLLSFPLLFTLSSPAVITHAVKNSSHWVDHESMFLQQMPLNLFQILAVQMNQPPASGTFAVETVIRLLAGIFSHIFKTRRSASHRIFPDYTFVYQALQSPIHRRLPYGKPLFFKVSAHIPGGNMLPCPALQILQKQFTLFCLVFASFGHFQLPPGEFGNLSHLYHRAFALSIKMGIIFILMRFFSA
jgi:hypothetical protein